MTHPIQRRIRRLRARVRRLVAVHGLSWVVAVVVGLVILLGLTDYLIRFRDPGLRVICSLVVLGALAATCYRYLYLPLLARLTEVDLALRVQRRFPALEDRLVSSVEFMKQSEDDPVAGSAALRRAVIAQTTAETERLDFSDVLDPRRPFRAALVTASVCLAAAILVALAPQASATAVLRLANPFGVPWPQKTHLEARPLVARAAKGRPLEINVVDARGTELPEEVQIHYLLQGPDGTVTETTETMRQVDDVARATIEPLRSFSYRVEGGDDHGMPWHPVQVVAPPGLASSRLTLIPPDYTGWPSQPVEGKLIRALVGTRVQLSARATEPLKSALLHLEDGRRIDALSPDRDPRAVAAEFTIENATEDEKLGAAWLELTDQTGLTGEVGWEIRAVPDKPPTVSIKRPSDTVFVTPQGVVPLEVAAADDVAIHQLGLAFSPAGPPEEGQPETEPLVLPMWTGPQRVEPRPGGALSPGAEPADRRDFEHRWELAKLNLAPDTELLFHVVATDYRPQTGQSEPRRLIVITPEQLQQRLADRQSLILAELARVLKMQRDCRKRVKSLEIRLTETGWLERPDLDRLRGTELNQREVTRSLADPSEGVRRHVLALLADLKNNRVDSPDIRRRMESLLAEIQRLQREHLALIGRELTAAIKAAEVRLQRQPASEPDDRKADPSGPTPPAAVPLAEAGSHQDQVIASLERLLDQLAEWDRYRRFHREISQLLREQQELTGRSAEVGRRTLSKELEDLLPQEVADLKILAGQQVELARQLDRIQQRIDRAAVELRQADPLAAETLADALAEARRLAISGQMRTAGGQLESNQTGQATAGQRQIARDLQEVLDVLANRRQHELARLVKKLAEAEAELAEIQRRQAELRKQMEETSQGGDEARRRERLQQLAQEQAELQQQAERLARRLQRLLAEQAGQTTQQAAARMAEAAQSAGQGDRPGACQAGAAAEKALAQARRQLAARRHEAQAELAVEQLVQLEDTLKQSRRQQQRVLQETQRFADLQARGELSRAQTISLRSLARQQQALKTETDQLADKLSGAGAFQLTLSHTARSMGQAAALLNRLQTGAPTQGAENDALGRLDLLLEALKNEPPSETQPSGAGGQKGHGPPPEAVQMLAELKLLKLLQEEVNLRTAQLQKQIRAAGGPTDEQRREYEALGQQQGRLADLVSQLLEPEQVAPEDDPARLPGVPPSHDQNEPGLLPDGEEIP